MHEPLRDEVNRIARDLRRFTRDLIRIPSPSLHEIHVAERVAAELRALQFDLVFTDDVGNVVGILTGDRSGEAVLMTTHMDTEQPDRIGEWLRPPFGGELSPGRVHGVGAASCKGSLASLVYAAHSVAQLRKGRGPTIVVAATVAGAEGFGVGVRHLLRTTLPEIRLTPTFVLVGEPTTLAVLHGCHGRITLDVKVIGTDENIVRQETGRIREAMSAEGGHPPGFGWRSSSSGDSLRVRRTGERFVSELNVHQRLAPHQPADDAVRRFEDDLARAVVPDPRVDTVVRLHERDHHLYTGHLQRAQAIALPWATDPAHPLVVRARDAMVGAGCRWKLRGCGGQASSVSLSGSVAAGEFAFPVLGYGPGEQGLASACNESLSLPALESATFGSAILIEGVCLGSRQGGLSGRGEGMDPVNRSPVVKGAGSAQSHC